MEIDKSGQSVRAMFSAIAGRYDFLNHLLSANQDKRWRRRAIRLLTPRRGERILDLCCGTGDLAIGCARRQPACSLIGVDFAVPMLHIARQKFDPRSSILAPRFVAGDALRLPFPDGTFDAVMVAFGVRNFEDTAAGLREMHRVLKPGGRVLILEFMRPTSLLLQRGFGLFFKHVLPHVGRFVSRHGSAYNYLPASVEGFYTRHEFARLLRQTGFGNVRSFDYSGGIATSFIAVKSE
ncbi:MAG: bifunctional demethylmenaquinone methyltransferase/2-methoxy-6-polyprenyl-1,4-benzoquinol methylase UbiE [Armatimonadota bacterium]|nr:bifunctional demethylmenaquinone methyltransferase/2-methoxy-6-polyprenyl-1,4-benzoquinol methylase UbiE [Armatimonadota bacterium]